MECAFNMGQLNASATQGVEFLVHSLTACILHGAPPPMLAQLADVKGRQYAVRLRATIRKTHKDGVYPVELFHGLPISCRFEKFDHWTLTFEQGLFGVRTYHTVCICTALATLLSSRGWLLGGKVIIFCSPIWDR